MFSHKGDTFIYTLALFYTMSVFHLLKSCEINTTDFFSSLKIVLFCFVFFYGVSEQLALL